MIARHLEMSHNTVGRLALARDRNDVMRVDAIASTRIPFVWITRAPAWARIAPPRVAVQAMVDCLMHHDSGDRPSVDAH